MICSVGRPIESAPANVQVQASVSFRVMGNGSDEPEWRRVQKLQRKRRVEKIEKYIKNSWDGQTLVITAKDIEEDVDIEASRGTVTTYMKELASDRDDMRVEEKGGATTLIFEQDPPYQLSLAFRSIFDHVNGKTYDGKLGTFYFTGIVGSLGPLVFAIPVLLAFVVDPIPAPETFATTLVVMFPVSIVVLLLTVPRTDPDALQAKK